MERPTVPRGLLGDAGGTGKVEGWGDWVTQQGKGQGGGQAEHTEGYERGERRGSTVCLPSRFPKLYVRPVLPLSTLHILST